VFEYAAKFPFLVEAPMAMTPAQFAGKTSSALDASFPAAATTNALCWFVASDTAD